MSDRGRRYDGRESFPSYGRPSGSSEGSRDFRAVAPPKQISKLIPSPKGYTKQTQIQKTMDHMPSYDQLINKPRTEEDYWNEDEDETPQNQKKSETSDDEDEEDPLDAFMAGLNKEIKGQKKPRDTPKSSNKGIRDDIECEDDEESYYKFMKENPLAGTAADEDDPDVEYDEDGNPIAPLKSKWIDPLPAMDHTTIQYEPFERNFYEEHPDITSLSADEVQKLRNALGIKVLGAMASKPVVSFAHMNLDGNLMKAVRKALYETPTPIQAQAIPLALSGRDLIGIAKTGSGKTLSFIIPILVHLMNQAELKVGDGPIGLILAPTRELAMQIYTEAKKFAKVYNVNVACCFGGGSKWEQSKTLAEGAEIIVATPGRMIDMIKIKATNLERVTFLVLDEADRMFDMGFEPQVRSICNHVRPDRQCLMFSATFKKRIEKLARDVLSDPVKIIQGDVGEATEDVTQLMIFIREKEAKDIENKKFQWLADNLVGFCSQGSVLIFVTKKASCEIVAEKLRQRDHKLGMLHGDIDQSERTKLIAAFKRQDFSILVATDVCARGLDISHIRTVVNFDTARDIDTHTHRVGRTGRAGQKGVAYTLFSEKDKEFAGHLVRNLEGANQKVSKDLMDLAMQSQWFRKSRFKQGKGKHFEMKSKERPGFGCTAASSSAGSSSTRPQQPSLSETLGAQETPGEMKPVNRLAVMKAAYWAQFRTQFRAASEVEKPAGHSSAPPPPQVQPVPIFPPPSGPSPPTASHGGPPGAEEPKKKRSRWH